MTTRGKPFTTETAVAASAANPKAFTKGVSGNPGGRPKGLERTAREALALRSYKAADGVTYQGADAAIQCLLDMGFSETVVPRERIAAFKEALDRGYGKAKQSVVVSGEQATSVVRRPASEMSDEELHAGLNAIRTLKELGVVSDGARPTEH